MRLDDEALALAWSEPEGGVRRAAEKFSSTREALAQFSGGAM